MSSCQTSKKVDLGGGEYCMYLVTHGKQSTQKQFNSCPKDMYTVSPCIHPMFASFDSEDQSTVHLRICIPKSVETYSGGVCSVFCLDTFCRTFRCFWILGTLRRLLCYLVHLSPRYITFNASNVCLTLATVAKRQKHICHFQAWSIIYINFHSYGHSNHGSKWIKILAIYTVDVEIPA